jgi:hypothetical protein
VSGPTVADVDLPTVHFACDRLAGELLKSEVNGRFNQRHAAKLHVAPRENLTSDRTRGANHKVGSHAQDGIIRRLKQSIQALRSAISAVPSHICAAAFPCCTIGLCRYILRREAANDEIGHRCRDQYCGKPDDEIWH